MAMSSANWTPYTEQGYDCWLGENEWLAVRVVPARGSKIVSFIDKRTGKEWIHRTGRPWEALSYGMQWGDGDRGGWDEMFPTINACPCPDEPWQSASFPDHGEVWCLPWRCELDGETLCLEVDGVQVAYRLSKRITLASRSLRIDYRLDNPTPHPFSYLWAAHPLLRIQPGMRLSTSLSEGPIQISYSHNERLGEALAFARFPIATTKDGDRLDLSIVENAAGAAAEKYYFADPLREGCARLTDPATGASIAFRFSPEETPYLAIWANYGGFDDYTFAIEPASGYMDSVYAAKQMDRVRQVEAYATNRWTLEVSLQDCV